MLAIKCEVKLIYKNMDKYMFMEERSMDNLKIVEFNDVNFDEYKKWVNKYINKNDWNEIRFQNEVVKPFISAIFPNLDVEDVSTKRNSPNHDYHQYGGLYTDKDGKEKVATPDLVIAKNWNWLNKENDVEYYAVVEVKSPGLKQAIYCKDYQKYDKELKDELKRHLSSTKNDKVILTDTLKWEFYKKDSGLVPVRTFELYNFFQRGNWEWKKGEQVTVKDDIINEIFGHGVCQHSCRIFS